MKNICLFVVSLMIFVSCGHNFHRQTIKDEGVIVTKERTLSPYNQIVSTGSFDVVLTEGEVGKVKIEASENIEPYILTEISGGILTISMKSNKSYEFRSKILVYIPVNQSLNKISLTGSGDMDLKFPLKVNNLECVVTGSGDVDLNLISEETNLFIGGSGDIDIKGVTEKFKLGIGGSGDIDAKNFKAEIVEAKIMGSGDIQVNAKSEVNASIFGSGNIVIYGNPQKRNTQIKGSGNIDFK